MRAAEFLVACSASVDSGCDIFGHVTCGCEDDTKVLGMGFDLDFGRWSCEVACGVSGLVKVNVLRGV